ncbi:hypothetical protein K8I61_08880 [bacterium]|nr:hypothetical protein [bacterium]
MTLARSFFVLVCLSLFAAAGVVVSCGDFVLEDGEIVAVDDDDDADAGADDDAGGNDGFVDMRDKDLITYDRHIRPILANNCASCHQQGGVAPFPLLTYEDARRFGALITDTVTERTMPPWQLDSSGECGTYHNAQWLSGRDIALINEWAEEGFPEGNADEDPIDPREARTLDPDLVVDMGVDFIPRTSDGEDVYRCFIIDLGLEKDIYATAYEFVPGQQSIVHHALIAQPMSQGAVNYVRRLDDEDAIPGFDCYATLPANSTLIALAGPAGGANDFPATTGLRLDHRFPVVLQMHYTGNVRRLADRTVVNLKTAQTVERPAFVLQSGLPEFAMNFELPPGESRVERTHEFPIQSWMPDIRIWGVTPHMHEAGSAYKMEIVRGKSSAIDCAARINQWNFHWQLTGWYKEPVVARVGDKLRVTCVFDTADRTETTRWGMSSSDEMCNTYLYVTRAD